MRRRVFVEVAEVEKREDHLLISVHRDGQSSHDRLSLLQRERPARLQLLMNPVDGLSLLLEGKR